jgi:hypothetical protein
LRTRRIARRGPKFPRVEVQLIGEQLNAFKLVNKVREALERAGVPVEKRREFARDALSDDMDHLIATCARWVSVK